MIRDLSHVLAHVFNVPLLIEPARIEPLLLGLYATMFRRGALSPPGDAPAPPEERPRGYRVDRGVATLPVRGVLVRRAGQMTPDSTLLQSYQNLTQVLRAARSDNRVRGILLEVDSPGGEAGGVFDFADEVRRTAQIKPVWAIANDDALSAAYAIAAAAERVWITNTGAAGSIGVVALHADQSRFDAEAGFNFTYIYKGDRKIDANPHEPLSAAARGQIQGEVNRIYDMLIAKVAGHRQVALDRLRATEAEIYFGDNALGAGLADRLGTIDEAHAALAEHVSPNTRRGTGMTTEDQTDTEIETRADNVVNLDEVRAAAVAATRESAGEIASRCALAGYPQLAADYIKSGTTLDTVVRELQARQASAAAHHVETIDTTARRAATGGAEIAAAVAARFAAQSKRAD